jgi:FkbM family methyltransferase
MYSQNDEEIYIKGYFQGFTGTLLDLGANDGKTLSNSLALIESGWKAILVEPSKQVFNKLKKLHSGNSNVVCLNYAITERDGECDFFDSGTHFGKGDLALLSTVKKEETTRFPGTAFAEKKTLGVTIKTLLEQAGKPSIDFVSIDCEGMDWEILQQLDLNDIKMICVEHNSVDTKKYIDYCLKFGLVEIYRNAENVIMAI